MKRKGMILSIEFVILIVIIILLSGGGLYYYRAKASNDKDMCINEMQMIARALDKYALAHRGSIPVNSSGNASTKYQMTTSITDLSGTAAEAHKPHFITQEPGLYPVELYELVELGYLPGGFAQTLSKYKYTTAPNSKTVTTVYTGNNYSYTYKVEANNNTSNGYQYTKFTLSFTSTKFTLPAISVGTTGTYK